MNNTKECPQSEYLVKIAERGSMMGVTLHIVLHAMPTTCWSKVKHFESSLIAAKGRGCDSGFIIMK